MSNTEHVYILKRRREGKTDYRKRKNILMSRSVFVTPRISDKNVSVQFSKPTQEGDQVVASANSQELYKIGWKGSGKSIPGAYLTGLIAGLKALKAGVDEAVLYAGLRRFASGSRLSAVLKGILDAGVNVPAQEDVLPADERIRGEHIAEYAKSLSEQNRGAYEKRFSRMVKMGLKPEEYPDHFEETKKKIQKTYGVTE
ncbi:MAG: 50S ribosomal protein L18 [Thaumarchaeota archaeon]|nr:50S ribosomal protein L18 [Nitrososphaerota archaeon]MCL5317993.1 50S ribosomal protein L18 [Nitrososphaerota archaeon]